MTTNPAQIPNDESHGESRRPSAAVSAAPRKPFLRRALGLVRHKLDRLVHRLDLAILPMAASGQRSAALYYLFFKALDYGAQRAPDAPARVRARPSAAQGTHAVAKRETVKAQPERALDLWFETLCDQQRMHAHSVREPLALETFQLPMQACCGDQR